MLLWLLLFVCLFVCLFVFVLFCITFITRASMSEYFSPDSHDIGCVGVCFFVCFVVVFFHFYNPAFSIPSNTIASCLVMASALFNRRLHGIQRIM